MGIGGGGGGGMGSGGVGGGGGMCFLFQNNPKDLGPSYKINLDLKDCFGREKPEPEVIKKISCSVQLTMKFSCSLMLKCPQFLAF